MVLVVKKNGDVEEFDREKVIRSLRNSQASDDTINSILGKLDKKLYNKIPTKKIFQFVSSELKKNEKISGTRYGLKQAMMEMTLGGGFVFEKFMGRVFSDIGFETKMNRIVSGKNITHEIDISLKKDDESTLVECKHFNSSENGISIQTALYVYARFLDLKKEFNKVMLVTNTKFSNQVVDYSNGVGLKLLGWKYPLGAGLEKIIEDRKLYPITVLPLKKTEIKRFLEREILTVRELLPLSEVSSETKELIKKLISR